MPVEQMTPETLATRLASDKVCLLDVREAWERDIASIEPALAMPMNTVADRLEELRRCAGDRDLVVMCHSGARSQRVAEFLNQEGFAGVFNLEGGIAAWSNRVDPSVPHY